MCTICHFYIGLGRMEEDFTTFVVGFVTDLLCIFLKFFFFAKCFPDLLNLSVGSFFLFHS